MKNVMKNINIGEKAIKIAGTGGGAYLGVKANKIGFLAKQTPLVRGAIKAAVGAFLPDILKGVMKSKKADPVSNIIGHAGDGLIAVGALEMATALDATVPALGDIPTLGSGQIVFDEAYTNGVGQADVMGATEDDSIVYD